MARVVHRYYDPGTSQFLSVDPLANVTGTPYAFVGGDPVNGSDPSGLSPWGWVAHQVGAFLNGIGSNLSGNGSSWCDSQTGRQRQFACSGGSAVGEVGTWIAALAGALHGDSGGAAGDQAALDDALASAEADSFATKVEARGALSGLGCPEEQQVAANKAIGRATSSSGISVSQAGQNIIVRITRPGSNGYQVIMSVIGPNGQKRVVQIAYNSTGQMVHYDPKTP